MTQSTTTSTYHCRRHPYGPHLGLTVITGGLWLPVWAYLHYTQHRTQHGTQHGTQQSS